MLPLSYLFLFWIRHRYTPVALLLSCDNIKDWSNDVAKFCVMNLTGNLIIMTSDDDSVTASPKNCAGICLCVQDTDKTKNHIQQGKLEKRKIQLKFPS